MDESTKNVTSLEEVAQELPNPSLPSPIKEQPPKPAEPLKAPARPSVQSRNSSMNGPLYMQTSNNKVLIRRAKRKGDGPLKSLSRWFLDNQAGFSFNLLALLFLTHMLMPKARPYTTRFYTLSHYNQESGLYAAGPGDTYFIAFCVVLFTGLRAGCMEHVLAPLAKAWGISKKKDITRFAEQAWLLVYYFVFWPLGFYLYYQSPYWMNLKGLWIDWPIRETDGVMKAYMLAQWAFWLQQVLVIHIEERRKDHWQMLTHHFVTIGLIAASYAYHHTRVGHLILVLMDIVDLFFPLAKCLKYLGYTTACDMMFGLFVISWFLARHVAYLTVCWSIYVDIPQYINLGCYRGGSKDLIGPFPPPAGFSYLLEPFQDPEGTVCFNSNIAGGFLAFLLVLQAITLSWFCLIVRLVIRVLQGGNADDPRSDDEAGEETDEEFEYEVAHPLEEEVGVESIDLKNWERRAGVKRTAASSGVSLPGHSDRKELLGRIGCEKQVD
ncbi:longevity-assurance protein [Seiridium cupressi]|uniref:TLC domain-containing protein n=1 Tax=Seiridium unicorne TaxID=138068 RepID=A0ABR2UWB6_9PEZI